MGKADYKRDLTSKGDGKPKGIYEKRVKSKRLRKNKRSTLIGMKNKEEI